MAKGNNLKPFNTLTVEEQRKITSKGGKASVKARREKKLMREQMEMLLSLPLKNEQLKAKIQDMGIDSKDVDNQMALIISIWNKALKGDMSAVNQIREIIGEKVIEVNVNQNIDNNVKEFDEYVNKRKTT